MPTSASYENLTMIIKLMVESRINKIAQVLYLDLIKEITNSRNKVTKIHWRRPTSEVLHKELDHRAIEFDATQNKKLYKFINYIKSLIVLKALEIYKRIPLRKIMIVWKTTSLKFLHLQTCSFSIALSTL
ncbi:hypothetical protein RCL_jg20392.t1 [Rhizophagus clarus]|uniref:Uncharacterized protein n=1 Tax=Rhizophagus clarus TaxID=94130 RepID=A0A8H3QGI8_9GLOM|nr:hypothetical protein RCL_jg20392.t1 [Rhizophagus clarus]